MLYSTTVLPSPPERPPKGIPDGYRGPAWLSSGRPIYWTGRVAIGRLYQPAANGALAHSDDQVQTALLRKVA